MRNYCLPVLTLCLIHLSPNLLAAAQPAAVPAQVIPDRRAFPVSAKVSPCDNFYEYACSEVNRGFKLRPDRSKHTFAFDDSAERLLEKKKAFLKDLATKPIKTLPVRSADLATVYQACMDPAARKREELDLVASTQKQLNALSTHESFQVFLDKLGQEGKFNFFQFGPIANFDKPEWYDFYFVTTMMSLPERSYYENPEVRKDYEKVLQSFFETVGSKQSAAQAKAVLALETEFAKIAPLPAEWRDIVVKRSEISKDKLQKLYPAFQLETILKKVPNTTKIRHFTPETFAFVQKSLASGDLQTLKSLYLFERLAPLMDEAYPAFWKKYHDFNVKHLGEAAQRPSKEERCTRMVMNTFTKELDAELLPQMFPNFPEEKFVALAESVRKSIIDGITANDWLSEAGKAGAIDKMKKAKLQLVKPRTEEEWYFNPKAEYDVKTPLANIERLGAKLLDRTFAELAVKRNPDIWAMGPLEVNAYYSAEDNKFVMPLGILQYPFYDPSLPVEVNLGAVGAVIGHELGHGIDDQGAKFDAQGQLKQWMSDKDLDGFKSRGTNFVQQFNEAGVNGDLTLGENIGDLTGVTFAYRAAFPDGKGTSEMKREFFLQYARVWCQTIVPKLAEQLKKVDPHSPGWARVNMQMKNQKAFAEAFSCQAKDKMVLPTEKAVKIW